MDRNSVVRVKQLSKKFNRDLKRSFVSGLQALVGHPLGNDTTTLKPGEFWALQNVDLQLARGESLGLVGNNGSGKTTLLRLIAGVISPTSGMIETEGKIAPMLALGAGFEPGLSGSQNVYLNMSLLGLTTDEIAARYKEVIDFAEIGESINAPLGTYSTGMRMRLGFACAVHTDPQLLIIDEVLSVGDANFRVKCRNKINEIRRSGASLILVSHSRLSIEYLADRAIYLRKGKIEAQGDVNDVLDAYENDQKSKPVESVILSAADEPSTPKIVVDQVRFLTELTDNEIQQIYPGEDLVIEIRVTANTDVEQCSFEATFQAADGAIHYPPNATKDEKGWASVSQGSHVVRMKYAPVIFLPGTYSVKIDVSQSSSGGISQSVTKNIEILRPHKKTLRAQYIAPVDIDVAGLQLTVSDSDYNIERAKED